jgi:hypothetical protein
MSPKVNRASLIVDRVAAERPAVSYTHVFIDRMLGGLQNARGRLYLCTTAMRLKSGKIKRWNIRSAMVLYISALGTGTVSAWIQSGDGESGAEVRRPVPQGLGAHVLFSVGWLCCGSAHGVRCRNQCSCASCSRIGLCNRRAMSILGDTMQ